MTLEGLWQQTRAGMAIWRCKKERRGIDLTDEEDREFVNHADEKRPGK